MNRLFREFHAVGQGAFYSETFAGCGRINIVYDCGSESGIKYVEREIKSVFEENETIHALFISHLHEDHINGIPYLIEYCNVKKIFFPLMTEESKLLLKVSLYIEGKNGFAYKFIDNPRQAISEILNEKGIENKEIGLVGIHEGENIGKRADTYDKAIASGQNVSGEIEKSLEHIDWFYIPYNFRQKDRIQALKDALEGNGISCDKLAELCKKKEVFKERIKAVKGAYEKVKGGFNSNSMTLFSGISSYSIRGIYDKCWIRYCDCRAFGRYYLRRLVLEENISCLYTGDYDASKEQTFNELKNKYSEYWPSIGCIQIPHHGSRHNHNIKMMEQGLCYIISAGYKNKYNHPDSRVIKDILLEGGMPFIVTEKTSSRVFFCVHFY